jgi:hypothetical protein
MAMPLFAIGLNLMLRAELALIGIKGARVAWRNNGGQWCPVVPRASGAALAPRPEDQEVTVADSGEGNAWKTFTEEIEVTGNQLVAQITRLIAEGNIRTISVRSQNSDVHFEIPLTAGVVTGGIVALAAPWLVVLGALAGLVAKLRVEVVRQQPADDKTPAPPGTAGAEAAPPTATQNDPR